MSGVDVRIDSRPFYFDPSLRTLVDFCPEPWTAYLTRGSLADRSSGHIQQEDRRVDTL